MAIRESLLNTINSIATSDFVRAVTSAGASSKVTVSNLAQTIIENYTGSTLAGSNQSVKSGLDSLKQDITGLDSLFKPIRVSKSYTNLTMPSVKYLKIDSFAGLGVSTDHYSFNAIIRGWNGTVPYGIVKGGNGTDFYLTGDAGSISSITIEYWFFKYGSVEVQ